MPDSYTPERRGATLDVFANAIKTNRCWALLREAGGNIAIPILNQTPGSAIIARNMRMEACSPLAASRTAGAQDCEYDLALTNTYLVGTDYTAAANRCGNAVINRHRAAAFRQSATEVGVERLITTATFMADFCFNWLTDVTPADRAVTLAAIRCRFGPPARPTSIGTVVQSSISSALCRDFARSPRRSGARDRGRSQCSVE